VAIPAVVLDRVSKHFEGRRRVTALEDVNLTIPKGELVSIVGPSPSMASGWMDSRMMG
jgi:ABC-type nitrate/sulfonate/bicarbonate transport system ATPase subunit